MPSKRRPAKPSVRRANYAAYIASPEWAATRAQFWSQNPRLCARCGSTENLHVHHMTYARFKKELMSDLIGVCRSCHALIHRTHAKYGGDLHAVTIKVVSAKRVVSARASKPKPRKRKKDSG